MRSSTALVPAHLRVSFLWLPVAAAIGIGLPPTRARPMASMLVEGAPATRRPLETTLERATPAQRCTTEWTGVTVGD